MESAIFIEASGAVELFWVRNPKIDLLQHLEKCLSNRYISDILLVEISYIDPHSDMGNSKLSWNLQYVKNLLVLERCSEWEIPRLGVYNIWNNSYNTCEIGTFFGQNQQFS